MEKLRAMVLFVSVAPLVAFGGGCMKKQREIYEEAKPAAAPLRAKMIAATQLIEKRQPPPPGSSCKAGKKLTYSPKADGHDTDYMMFEEAKRGGSKKSDAQPDEDLDLHLSGPFAVLMRGTAPESPYAGYVTNEYAKSDFADEIKRAQNVENLVIVKSHGTTLDYYLVDLAPASPTIVCAGSVDATADPSLGTRQDDYDIVTKNKRTGKEVKREHHSDTHDDRKSALFVDGRKKLAARAQADFGTAGPD